MRTQRITMPIYNLSCGGGGALTVERVLVRTTGVIHAYVNPATEMAYVEYDPTRVSPERLADTVEQTGFHAGAPCPR